MKKNRSAPNTAVIPVLYYPDVREAVEWLTTALPFTERLRNSDDRRQLSHSNGAIVVTKPGGDTLPRLVRLKLAHMRSTLIWLLLATGLADLLATGRRCRPRVA